jgi:uridine kinase
VAPSPQPPAPTAPTARVVLLAGPSGCGKTHLARSAGLPIVALDDFYRDGTDPDLPRLPDGHVDWDHPGSWDGDAALAALDEICRTGRVEVPTYVIGENAAVGCHVVDRGDAPIVIAEGIFAAELVEPLRQAGLLADALLLRQGRWVTFLRRLTRDLREGRKPPWYLVRQGWAKAWTEPAVVEHQCALGARLVTKPDARARLTELTHPPRPTPEAAAA